MTLLAIPLEMRPVLATLLLRTTPLKPDSLLDDGTSASPSAAAAAFASSAVSGWSIAAILASAASIATRAAPARLA